MISATIAEAQMKFVELMERARGGETVVITDGEDHQPVIRLQPIAGVGKRLGFLDAPGWEFPESFWDPLPEEELRLWNGEGE